MSLVKDPDVIRLGLLPCDDSSLLLKYMACDDGPF